MERTLKIGDHVVYVDPQRVEHAALVTHVWQQIAGGPLPGCNLTWVSADEARTDTYGRQIERNTSVVHLSMQPAQACCWRWPDEA
jgi:hypothetical protein